MGTPTFIKLVNSCRQTTYPSPKSQSGGNSLQVDEVWAVDASGRIYISPLHLRWSGKFLQVPGSLAQIAVGVGYSKCHPYEVWGINGFSQIYRYYCSGRFEQIAGLLKQLSVGGGDVWGINDSKQIFRFDPQTSTFKQLPGLLTQITVGVDGVWGINASHQIYQFNPSTGHFGQLRGSLRRKRSLGNQHLQPNFPF
jgi:hypothetical protein